MNCKKHGYTNNTFCPACDLETIENAKMTNTERLAQALRRMDEAYCEASDHMTKQQRHAGRLALIEARAALVEHDAIASLAPAAVEGGAWNDAALFVNTCDSAYEQSTQFWRATSTEGHDLVAFQTTTGHLMQQCLRRTRKIVADMKENTAAQVAALTAQCDGLRKEVLSVADDLDFDQWFNASKYMQVVYSPDSRQPALDGWNAALARAAPAEPRAAEGAGTVRMMKDSNGDIHEECPDCRGECTPVECDTKPTAAAAVPAGGDAVAWRYWVSDTNHSVWHDMPVDQENRADCEELGYQVQYAYTVPAPRGGVTEAMDVIRQEMRDHPDYAWSWQCNVAMAAFDAGENHREANECAADFMRNAFDVDVRATEFWKHLFPTQPSAQAQDAEQKRAWQEFKRQWDDVPEALKSLVPWPLMDSLQTLGRAMETQPTGDAQDAGPMARHWREAIKEWWEMGDEFLEETIGYLDWIEQRARALAAKEAK